LGHDGLDAREVAHEQRSERIGQPPVGRRHESLDDQVRRRGLKPIKSADNLVCDGIFDTDEELDEFL
jgi:hypothetical protein